MSVGGASTQKAKNVEKLRTVKTCILFVYGVYCE
nr:MAG TPA: hypothetical protein [Caudoviricetes sp.]